MSHEAMLVAQLIPWLEAYGSEVSLSSEPGRHFYLSKISRRTELER